MNMWSFFKRFLLSLFFIIELTSSDLFSANHLIQQDNPILEPSDNQLLLIAARQGEADEITRLLQEGASIHYKDHYKRSALYYSVAGEHEEAFEVLLDTPEVRVDLRDHRNVTPLHVASYLGNVFMIEKLLALGANPNAKNDRGCLPVHFAIHSHMHNALALLVESPCHLKVKDSHNWNLFHWAAVYNNPEAIDYLSLQPKAPAINEAVGENMTALKIAYLNRSWHAIGSLVRSSKLDLSDPVYGTDFLNDLRDSLMDKNQEDHGISNEVKEILNTELENREP